MPDSDALTAAREKVLDWGPDIRQPARMERFRQDVAELERLAADRITQLDADPRAGVSRTFEIEFAHASTRIFNALRHDARNRGGRDWTLVELAKVADRTLLLIRHFGPTALAEVRSWETDIDRATVAYPEDADLPADAIVARDADGRVWTPEEVGEALTAVAAAAAEQAPPLVRPLPVPGHDGHLQSDGGPWVCNDCGWTEGDPPREHKKHPPDYTFPWKGS